MRKFSVSYQIFLKLYLSNCDFRIFLADNLVKPKKRKKVVSRRVQRKMRRDEKKTKKKNFYFKNVKSETTTKQKPQVTQHAPLSTLQRVNSLLWTHSWPQSSAILTAHAQQNFRDSRKSQKFKRCDQIKHFVMIVQKIVQGIKQVKFKGTYGKMNKIQSYKIPSG